MGSVRRQWRTLIRSSPFPATDRTVPSCQSAASLCSDSVNFCEETVSTLILWLRTGYIMAIRIWLYDVPMEQPLSNVQSLLMRLLCPACIRIPIILVISSVQKCALLNQQMFEHNTATHEHVGVYQRGKTSYRSTDKIVHFSGTDSKKNFLFFGD